MKLVGKKSFEQTKKASNQVNFKQNRDTLEI